MTVSYTVGDEPVPGYRLVQLLGWGRFGEVWKAVTEFDDEVALKIVSLHTDQSLKELRSVRVLKRISHPNLVPLIALWVKDCQGNLLDEAALDQLPTLRAGTGELILAMGLAEMSLWDRLQECRRGGLTAIPPDELLDYLADAGAALDFLNRPIHTVDSETVAVQHCDVKPQNILLRGRTALLCDLGVARAIGDGKDHVAVGSAAYMAPEFILHNKPSPASDQYSLAITYCELRTGRLPLRARLAAAAYMAHVHGQLVLDGLDPLEREVIAQATSLQPENRFPSCSALVNALRMAVAEADTPPDAGVLHREWVERPVAEPEPEPAPVVTLVQVPENVQTSAAEDSEPPFEYSEPPADLPLESAGNPESEPEPVAEAPAVVAFVPVIPEDQPPMLIEEYPFPEIPPAPEPVVVPAPEVVVSPLPVAASVRTEVARPPARSLLWPVLTLLAFVAGAALTLFLNRPTASTSAAPPPEEIVAQAPPPTPPGPAPRVAAPPNKPAPAPAEKRFSAPNPVTLPPLPPDPPVVFTIEGREGSWSELADAVAAAGDGDAVVVHGSQSIPVAPLSIRSKALTIKAAPGKRPRFRPTMTAKPQWGSMLSSDRALTLQGIELLRDGDDRLPLHLLYLDHAPLQLVDCMVLTPNSAAAVVCRHPDSVRIVNSTLRAASLSVCVEVGELPGCTIHVEATTLRVLDRQGAALAVWAPEHTRHTAVQLVMQRNVVEAGRVASFAALSRGVSIDAKDNDFTFHQALLSFSGLKEAGNWRSLTRWQGNDNRFRSESSWVQVEGQPALETGLAAWQSLWQEIPAPGETTIPAVAPVPPPDPPPPVEAPR